MRASSAGRFREGPERTTRRRKIGEEDRESGIIFSIRPIRSSLFVLGENREQRDTSILESTNMLAARSAPPQSGAARAPGQLRANRRHPAIPGGAAPAEARVTITASPAIAKLSPCTSKHKNFLTCVHHKYSQPSPTGVSGASGRAAGGRNLRCHAWRRLKTCAYLCDEKGLVVTPAWRRLKTCDYLCDEKGLVVTPWRALTTFVVRSAPWLPSRCHGRARADDVHLPAFLPGRVLGRGDQSTNRTITQHHPAARIDAARSRITPVRAITGMVT